MQKVCLIFEICLNLISFRFKFIEGMSLYLHLARRISQMIQVCYRWKKYNRIIIFYEFKLLIIHRLKKALKNLLQSRNLKTVQSSFSLKIEVNPQTHEGLQYPQPAREVQHEFQQKKKKFLILIVEDLQAKQTISTRPNMTLKSSAMVKEF